MAASELLRLTLIYGIVPLWLAAGVADYLCHRAAAIERTSGPKESLLHLLQFAEAGAALLGALLLEVGAAVLAFLVLCFIAHQATAIWDVRYANDTRHVSPAEQHVHGMLEMLLPAAIVAAAIMDWPALADGASSGARFAVAPKNDPLPGWYLASLLPAAGAIAALYGEELVRTLAWRNRRAARTPEIAQAPGRGGA